MDDDELNQLLRGLKPERDPPALDDARVFGEAPRKASRSNLSRWAPFLALAAVVVGALLLNLPGSEKKPDTLSFRGQHPNPILPRLTLYQSQLTPSSRLTPAGPLPVGTILYFELDSDQDTEVYFWAEEGQKTTLGTHTVLSRPTPVMSDASSLLGWKFEQPGPVTFVASTTESCMPETCVKITVEAK